MKKEILFFTATHGDERIGVEVMERIKKKNNYSRFDWIIGNEKALKKEVRFCDRDLNRSAPGEKRSEEYELRRAYQLLKIAKDYSYIIDLHGAEVDCGVFTIVSNPKPENLFLASALPIKRIVIWPAREWKEFGPLTQFVDCGLEIECGPKSSSKVKDKLFEIIESVIEEGITLGLEKVEKKEWFLVYGKLRGGSSGNLQDFQKIEIKKESFYPLLSGQYEDVTCYKMRKIDFFNQFSY